MACTTLRLGLLLMLSPIGITLSATVPPATVWTVIAADPSGDARDSSGIDAAQLGYQYDAAHDIVWFRIWVFGKENPGDMKIEFAIDTEAPTGRATWWGANKAFTFDRLATVRVTRKDGNDRASVIVRSADGSAATAGGSNDHADVRVTPDLILIGLKRSSLLGPTSMKMHLIVAIGTSDAWNDDLPNRQSAAVDLSAPRPTRGLREIDVSRNNLAFGAGQAVLADAAPPRITRSGRGPRTLILIPGVYSGESVFRGFMARNASAYTFHIVTPPGLNGTPARRLPPERTSVGEFTWTRRLARDILELIAREHLDHPIIVAHGFPGTLAAEELAVSHPHLLGGVVEVAGLGPQFFPSPMDPARSATAAERVTVVDESWVRFWFKYVTPETWDRNNYPAEMFANDSTRGQAARQQVESAPLPVKIRYLVESMASDHRAGLANSDVPILALIPGFNEQLLANPAFAWFKTSFQDGWQTLRQRPRLEVTTVPESRALMLDDQPSLTDEAILRFVERHAR